MTKLVVARAASLNSSMSSKVKVGTGSLFLQVWYRLNATCVTWANQLLGIRLGDYWKIIGNYNGTSWGLKRHQLGIIGGPLGAYRGAIGDDTRTMWGLYGEPSGDYRRTNWRS